MKHTIDYESLKDYEFNSLIACSSKDKKDLYAVVKGCSVTYEIREREKIHKFSYLVNAVNKYNEL